MTTKYFLGRELTGTELEGPDGGEEYDGLIWAIDEGDPDPDTGAYPEPYLYLHIDIEDDAVEVLKVLEERDNLRKILASYTAAVAARDRLLEACREVAAYRDCEEAADWKDSIYRLTSLCAKAIANAERTSS